MDHVTGRQPGVLHDRLVDGGLVVAAALFGSFVAVTQWRNAPPVPVWVLHTDHVVGVLGCLALWWRRRFPVALTTVLALISTVSGFVSIPTVVALFTVADRRSGRATAAMTALCLLAAAVHQVVRPEPTTSLPVAIAAVLTVHVAAVLWGLLVRSRRQLIASLRERASAAEVEARLRAEHAQHEARETLAREMHDVLGHRLSLLSVNAGALTYHPDASAEEIGRAAEAIRENARRALQDLREVIGVLRAPDGDVPLPGVADIVELVEETGRSGTPVELRDDPGVSTGGHDVPTTVGRTLYRFVQEGLTNARKHAPSAPVLVRITGGPGDHLTAEVVNERPDVVTDQPVESGEGLRGLAERASLVGGHLEHGPTCCGGWRLEMRLPWPT